MLKFFTRSICIYIFFFLCITNIFSQSDNSTTERVSSEESVVDTTITEESELFLAPTDQTGVDIQPFGIWDTIKVFLVLIILLVVGAGILLFFKRLQNPNATVNADLIEIMSTTTLSQGNSLHLIKLGGAYILLSQSNNAISVIKEFDKKEDIDEITLALSKVKANAPKGKKDSFFQSLQKKLLSTNTTYIHGNGLSSPMKNKNTILALFRSSKGV